MLFFMMGLVMGGIIIYAVWNDNETKSVDCFDRYGNKILNQVCLDEPLTNDEKFLVGFLGFFILTIFIFMGLLLDAPIGLGRY